MSSPRVSRPFPWRSLALAVVALVLLALFPPLHVRRLGVDGKPVGDGSEKSAAFDVATFTAEFWAKRLQPAAAHAPALTPIALAVRADPTAAAKQHGRKVGEGTTWYFFARGSGRVTAVEKSRLLVEVDGVPGATIAVRTGPVFGNVVRDGTGLLELNGVPGLAEFNAVAAELNRRIEQTVQPALKTGVAPGDRIAFAGCAEAPESVGPGPLLAFVPVQAELLR